MPKIKFIWLLVPGFVFLVLLAFLVSKAPRQTAVSTSQSSPNKTLTDSNTPNVKVPPQLQSLQEQIKSFRLDDPELTAPFFDRNLDIPAE